MMNGVKDPNPSLEREPTISITLALASRSKCVSETKSEWIVTTLDLLQMGLVTKCVWWSS